LRVTRQGSLLAKEYPELMMDNIDDVHESRFKALEEIEREDQNSSGIQQTCHGRIVSSWRSSMENDFSIGGSKW
jgi:hypothetical protein